MGLVMQIVNEVFARQFIAVLFCIVFLAVFGVLLKLRKRRFEVGSFVPEILEAFDKAIVVTGQDSAIEFVNGAALKLFRYEDSRELVGRKIDQVFEKGDESYCLTADRQKIPVGVSVQEVVDDSRHARGLVYAFRDISEKKQYEGLKRDKLLALAEKQKSLGEIKEALQKEQVSTGEIIKKRIYDYEEEHARLLASIGNLSMGFIMTDLSGNIVARNMAAVDFFPSLSGDTNTIAELERTGNIVFGFSESVGKSIKERKSVKISDEAIGSRFVNIFISPILDEGASPVCLGAVVLIEDRSEAHRLAESEEDLFSIASHELRTPLTAIYGYTSLIKQVYFGTLHSRELKDIINKIGLLSKKLSLSINNFLDSSKLEKGKIVIKKDACDLFTIINEAIKETERLATEKSLYVRFDAPSTLITVMGDQVRLIQVLIILLSNAIKFTHNGGVHVTVAKVSSSHGDSPGFVKVSVRDTGVGILEENKTLLFSKFQQADENLLTRQEGTGLGLHTAKMLVEKMGGRIQLEQTEFNKGSTFSFTVPLQME
jgi:signal transduction histidine kinase